MAIYGQRSARRFRWVVRDLLLGTTIIGVVLSLVVEVAALVILLG